MKKITTDSALGYNSNLKTDREAADQLSISKTTQLTKDDAAHTQCTKDYLTLCNE